MEIGGREIPAKTIGIGALVLVVGLTALSGFYTVNPTETAVVTRWGQIVVDKQVPGLHFKFPWAEAAHYLPIQVQELKVSSSDNRPINTYTVDNQEVDVSFNVFYRIPFEKAGYVFANYPDYEQRLLVTAIDRTKAVMGQVNIQDLANKRGEVRQKIKDILIQQANIFGLEVTDFNLTDLQYDKGFRAAVAQAAVQKANVESRIYELQQAEKEALKKKAVAEGDANAVREAARGSADARVFNAEAEAKARLVNADAEAKAIEWTGLAQAKAIKVQADALAAQSTLVEYTKAQRWDGKLPQNMYANVPIPFLNAPTGR